MNNAPARRYTTPQPLLSVASRVAIAVAVAAALVGVSIEARRASSEAVVTATQSFSNGPVYVTLEPVQVVGRRETADEKKI